MVTYFNKKDLVSFGAYLLSDERKARVESSGKAEVMLNEVSDADLENWLEIQKAKKSGE